MQHEMDGFLQTLFAGTSPAWFYLWRLSDKKSLWYCEDNLDDYFHDVEGHVIGDEDIYVGVCLSSQRGEPHDRVKSDQVAGMIGLWADIDYQDKVHSKSNLPKDLNAALKLVESIPLRPSLVVSSGHGLQCWWLFQEPWMFDSDEERQEGATLARRWSLTIKHIAGQHGCTVDSVFDLARVMRVPGTFNAKDRDSIQPVVVRTQTNERFNPSDFHSYLVDDVDTSRADVKVGHVSLDIVPPFAKFTALVENNANFRNLWFHKKKPSGDDSMSGYDLALANIAVQAGWDDQEILGLLIQHRHHWGELTKHPGYYELTIGKARNQHRFEEMATGIKTASEQGIEPPPVEKDDVLATVSEKLEIPIDGLIEYVGSPPRYRLILKTGEEINLGGSENIINQHNFRRKVMEVYGQLPRQLKNSEWGNMVNVMLRAREKVSLGDDMTEMGKLRDFLVSYLRSRTITTTGIEDAVHGKTAFYRDGHIYIFTRSFQRWLHDHLGERADTGDIAALLTRMGAQQETITYLNETTSKRTSTLARRLPVEQFAPSEFIEPSALSA